MAELKPCPFCGAKPILDEISDWRWGTGYEIHCPDETVEVGTKRFRTKIGAIRAWNRRISNDP